MSAILATQLEQSQIDELLQYVPAYSDSNFDSIRRKCLAKIHSGNVVNITDNIASSKRFNKKWIIIAAVIATLLLVAATFFSVSDLFRGVLKEQNPQGEAVPISSMSPIVDKTGTLVQETDRQQNLEVTVRGVVGDEKLYKILVDIVDLSGDTLALEQIDGSYSQGQIEFEKMIIRTEDTIENSFSGYYEWIDSDPLDNKTTVLICLNPETPLLGKTLYLTLENIVQNAVIHGTEVGMEPNDLYKIVNSFDPVSSADFQEAGYSGNIQTGETTIDYKLITDSGQQIQLADGLPNFFVTNAAVWNDVVYLRGVAPSIDDREILFNHPQLVNPQTGEFMQFTRGGAKSNHKTGEIDWTIAFENATSIENLKGFVLVLGAGDGLHPLREGEWNFEVSLNFQDLTRTVELNKEFSINDYHMTAKSLIISPYTLKIETAVDEETLNKMNYIENSHKFGPITTGVTAWDKLKKPATLIMKDGVTIPLLGVGTEDTSINYFAIDFDLQVVIDPEQVQAFNIGDLSVQLDQ